MNLLKYLKLLIKYRNRKMTYIGCSYLIYYV